MMTADDVLKLGDEEFAFMRMIFPHITTANDVQSYMKFIDKGCPADVLSLAVRAGISAQNLQRIFNARELEYWDLNVKIELRNIILLEYLEIGYREYFQVIDAIDPDPSIPRSIHTSTVITQMLITNDYIIASPVINLDTDEYYCLGDPILQAYYESHFKEVSKDKNEGNLTNIFNLMNHNFYRAGVTGKLPFKECNVSNMVIHNEDIKASAAFDIVRFFKANAYLSMVDSFKTSMSLSAQWVSFKAINHLSVFYTNALDYPQIETLYDILDVTRELSPVQIKFIEKSILSKTYIPQVVYESIEYIEEDLLKRINKEAAELYE